MTAAERIQSPEAAAITGLSLWQVQHMAVCGKIPGAAKLGSRWTFDLARLRRWIRDGETGSCQTISISAVALGTGACRYAGATLEEAYKQALG